LAAQQARCFFLDANIVISEILNENDERVLKLEGESKLYKIPCYISDTVKNEILRKVINTENFLGKALNETVKVALTDDRTKRKAPLDAPMDYCDIKALEELFSVCHGTAKSRKTCLMGPLNEIEVWAIKFISEELNQGKSLSIEKFIVELTKALLKSTSQIHDVYEYLVEFEKGHIKIKSVPVDKQIDHYSRLAEGFDIHYPDSLHIAVAYIYQLTKHEKVVFVTRDYGIINEKSGLWQHKMFLEISDPLYAICHF
jgi:hypothetical protein